MAVPTLRATLALGAEITCQHAMDTFLRVALVGKADDTVQWYKHRVGSLVRFLGADQPVIATQGIDLLDWYAALEEGELSVYTLHGYVRAVRRFFRWSAKWGLTPANIATDLDLPSLPQTSRVGIQEKDLEAMLSKAKDDRRDYALLRFFESTGCRLEGACGLLIEDLDLPLARAVVREKFTKDRTVFLNDAALEALTVWLAVRPQATSTHVFVGKSNGEDEYHALAPKSIYDRFALYAGLAGVKSNWSPHQWRHRFGRRMAQKNMTLGVLSQIMGHSSVDVTVRFYGQFAVEQLQQIYNRFC